MIVKITIDNQEEVLISNNEDINIILLKIKNLNSAEIWLEGYELSKLCILINKERAFFMYLKDEEGSSYVIHNQKEEIDEDDYEDFLLANGQLDEYPKVMTLDRNEIENVLVEYFKTGKPCESYTWIDG